MLSYPYKIMITGILGVVFLIGVYILMAMYADSVIDARNLSHVMAQVRLSALSDTDKQQILQSLYESRSRPSLSVNLSKSNAKSAAKGLSSAQCVALLVEFEQAAKICLESYPSYHRPLQVILSSCPSAETLTQEIGTSCNIDLEWR